MKDLIKGTLFAIVIALLVAILALKLPQAFDKSKKQEITQEIGFGSMFSTVVRYNNQLIYLKYDDTAELTDSIVIQRRKEAQEVLDKAIRLDSLVQSFE